MAGTVTALVFPYFTEALAKGLVTLGSGGDDVYVMLNSSSSTQLGTSYGSANEAIQTKAEVSSAIVEVSGTGYTAGGLPLTAGSFSVSTSTSYTAITYSGLIQWTNATFTAYEAVFIDMGASGDGTGIPICWWNFPAATCSNGTFTLTLGTSSGSSTPNCLIEFAN